jgi:hypothetical protein
MTIPTYLPYFVVTGTAATLVAILYGLTQDPTRALLVSAAILVGWLAVAISLSAAGVYHVNSSGIPTIQYGILLPILIGALMIWRSEATKRILEAVPQSWIVGVQLYRALGVIFLILYASGRLPGLFAWPAGVGDIAIGLLAPVVGLAYARAPREAAGLVKAWNACLAFSTSLSRLRQGSLPRPRGSSPSIVLHLASLTKLRHDTM